MIEITKHAEDFLFDNIKECDNLIIYISVSYPYTKFAYVNITFCKNEDLNKNDLNIVNDKLKIYIEEKSKNLLDNSIIDIKNNTLQINAPNLFISNTNTDEDIKNKIKNLFEIEINPILSQHGGFIELIDVENKDTIKIKFHGGCQGCGMVGVTMNNYIEKIIKKNFPDITNIKDITSHEIKKNAYY